jgi:DNA-binding beta-propeller fold protein YncE
MSVKKISISASSISSVLSALTILIVVMMSCRKDLPVFLPEIIPVAPSDTVVGTAIKGFYLLNEGNSGSNKATLDYFDYATGEYHRNIYADANPTVPMEIGDVGNDLQIYGSKLYAVINCSNKIEVMDAATTKRLGQIDIPNCRYIRFNAGYAYVTSYAGPVEININYEQRGYVAKIDTSTFQVVATCLVGFQPDELEIVGDKIYVANSGGYMMPNYENTVSVIDLATFAETKRIEVAINLHRLKADQHGNLWVSSRGNYYDIPSRLYWINTQTDTYEGKIDVPVSNFWLDGDSLYLYSAEFNYVSMKNEITYGIVDVATKNSVTQNFITDGTEKEITFPHGIMVHPTTKDIYLTDAFNNVYPGSVFCFDRHGKKKWQVRAGDIPAHFAIRR